MQQLYAFLCTYPDLGQTLATAFALGLMKRSGFYVPIRFNALILHFSIKVTKVRNRVAFRKKKLVHIFLLNHVFSVADRQ